MASVSRFAPSSMSLLLPRSLPPFRRAKPLSIRRHRLLSVPPGSGSLRGSRRLSGGRLEYSMDDEDEQPSDGKGVSFGRAVDLFNGGEYYRCHDFLEELWYDAEEPIRTLLHGILQCAVGLHHLFNQEKRVFLGLEVSMQNHRGAMMELGEGLCKLRKMDLENGPFFQFEEEVSAALEFLYQTQKELAACTSEICLPMDGSERSYQLLGSFAAGQQLYKLSLDQQGVTYISFSLILEQSSYEPLKVKVPTLHATEDHLRALEHQ